MDIAELTQRQIDRGARRPENVIGSYAVYHKSKKNNEAGGKHYKTGKAFHIYRPKAVDANGAEDPWTEVDATDDAILSVYVTYTASGSPSPQGNFLAVL